LLILVESGSEKAGETMKFFKQNAEETDGYAVLVDDLQRTGAELQIAYDNLQNVVDPDLIDYYIYQTKAVQMRYKFLLACVKKLEGKI
jgi:hypoxanthine phosphoribosyltransferase